MQSLNMEYNVKNLSLTVMTVSGEFTVHHVSLFYLDNTTIELSFHFYSIHNLNFIIRVLIAW
jgi:hypothetical protein